MRQVLRLSFGLALLAMTAATQSPASNCDYDCVELGTSYLRPTGVSRNFLNRGFETAIWVRPQQLKIVDEMIFKSINIPIWKDIQLNPGLYWNKFWGGDYDRRYISTGVSLGLLWHVNIQDRHELFAQGDFRLGGAYAHRVGADSSSANFQPVIFGGYKYHLSNGFIGIAAESLLSSDKNPLIAVGPTLRFGINLGAKQVTTPPQEISHTNVDITPSITAPITAPSEIHHEGTYVDVLADGAKVTLPVTRVSFAVGQSKLDAGGSRYMSGLSKILAASNADWASFEVSGHTDKRGPEPVNLRISKGRAEEVAAKLKSAGITAKKIVAIGRGSSDAIDNANTDDAHAKNRRVVIRILGNSSGENIARQIMDYERDFAKSEPKKNK